jgi:hypothetical protein
MLGVIGEYVWRIYDETRGRPMFIVRERHTKAPELIAGTAQPLESQRSAIG